MRAGRIFGCLVVALAVAAGGPAAAQGKAAQPPELLMSVGIGPDHTLDSIRAFANGMQPGVGMMVTHALFRRQIASMVTATSLEGLDDNTTIYVLAVDGGPALKGAAVVGKIADDAKLTQSAAPAHLVKKHGWAVIGPKAIAEKVAPFSFAALANQAVTGAPIATIYTANLMTRYKSELATWRQTMLSSLASAGAGGGQMTQMMQLYLDGLLSMVGDSDRVVVTFDFTKDVAALDLALVPKAGSRLGKFVAAQRPSDYALAGKLPATGSPALIVGRLDTGPYRAGLFEITTLMYGPGTPMTAALAALFKAATGEFAMAMTMAGPKGMEVTQLFGVSDPKAADRAAGLLFDLFKKPVTTTMMGLTSTHTQSPRPAPHDGVAIRGVDVTYDLSKAPPDTRSQMEKVLPKHGSQLRAALFDQLGVVVTSADGAAAVTAAIDAARGRGRRYTPATEVSHFFTGSRARKESVAMIVDLGAMTGKAPAGRMMMMSMGFADKRAHIRLALPATTVRGFAGVP